MDLLRKFLLTVARSFGISSRDKSPGDKAQANATAPPDWKTKASRKSE
jgi:hypothetical protein